MKARKNSFPLLSGPVAILDKKGQKTFNTAQLYSTWRFCVCVRTCPCVFLCALVEEGGGAYPSWLSER